MVRGRWRFGFVVLWAVAVIAAAWLADQRVGSEPVATVGGQPWISWLVGLVALGGLVPLFLALRRGVGADLGGVTVVNFGRSHRLRWVEIREVSLHKASSEARDDYTLEFLLVSGACVVAAKPTGDITTGGHLDTLRDRVLAVGRAVRPGQVVSRPPLQGKAQVVKVDPHRLESADVEVAAIMPTVAGSCRYRRLRCNGNDLPNVLALVFDPSVAPMVHGNESPDHYWVRDQDFDTPEEAMLAAQGQDPPARLADWLDEAAFRREVQGSGFKDSVRPQAERFGTLGGLLAGVVFATTFAPGITVVALIGHAVGLDQDVQAIFSLGVPAALGVFIAAWTAALFVAEPIRHHNLSKERNRTTSPGPTFT